MFRGEIPALPAALVPTREFDKDVFKGRSAPMKASQGPAVLGDEFVDTFAAIGAGVDEHFEGVPSVVGGRVDDSFNVVKTTDCSTNYLWIGSQLDEHFAGRAHAIDEFFRGVLSPDFAAIDNDHPTAGHFDLTQNVSGKEDGVIPSQTFDQLPDLADLVGVEAIRGFIENEQLGGVDQSVRQADPLAVAFGQHLDHFAANGLEAAGFDNFANPGARVPI